MENGNNKPDTEADPPYSYIALENVQGPNVLKMEKDGTLSLGEGNPYKLDQECEDLYLKLYDTYQYSNWFNSTREWGRGCEGEGLVGEGLGEEREISTNTLPNGEE